MQVTEKRDYPHDVILDNVPTTLEEQTCETVWPGGFVGWHFLNGLVHLLRGDGVREGVQVVYLSAKLFSIEVAHPRAPLSHGLGEVVVDNLLFGIMVGDPSLIMLKPVDEIFAASPIDPLVKKIGVCITLLDVGQSRALLLTGPLHDR